MVKRPITPPPDHTPDREDDLLRIDGESFINCIQRWIAAESIENLRQGLHEMQQRLNDRHDSLHSDEMDHHAVVFNKHYLIAELDQIAEALSLERSRYYCERLLKSIREIRTNAINDINLNRWKEYDDIHTDSLWMIDRRDSSGVHTAGYWGNFVPQIPSQMIRRYTKKGDWVLDTFAGSGTTLIEGQRLGRNTLGIELQPRMVEYIRHLVASEPNQYGTTSEVESGDSTTVDYAALLRARGQTSVQLVMMHPPYFDIIKFSEDPRDLSNAASIEAFLDTMGRLVDRVTPILDKGRYLVLVIGDKYVKGDWIPLGFQTMQVVMERGFALKSIVVKNFDDTSAKRNQKELWRYRALAGGFYIFKHEYIFLFRKQ